MIRSIIPLSPGYTVAAQRPLVGCAQADQLKYLFHIIACTAARSEREPCLMHIDAYVIGHITELHVTAHQADIKFFSAQ